MTLKIYVLDVQLCIYVKLGAKLLIMFFIHGIRPFLFGENNHYWVKMQWDNSKIKTLRKWVFFFTDEKSDGILVLL